MQTLADISLVKYSHMCDLQHHGTDLFWAIYVGFSIKKKEITCVIHGIMVPSFFLGHNEITCVIHRGFYTTDAFTRTHALYTHTLSHTETFTHRPFYTQRLLHTDAFTHRRFYTQITFTHRRLHRDFSHTDAFTHTHTLFFYTHTHFHTQSLLYTDAYTEA